MKNIISIILITLLSVPAYSQCSNGDLELGNFSNWNLFTGFNPGGTGGTSLATFVDPTDPGFLAGQHTVMSPGTDPQLAMYGFSLPTVFEGNFSMRLNSTNILNVEVGLASIASFTFNPSGKFSFAYSLVMEDPGHPAGQNPFFRYWLSRTNDLMHSTDPGNLIMTRTIEADASNPFFRNAGGGLVYKGWQTECIKETENLTRNDVVTIFFLVSNCQPGAHYAYAYIDALCKPNDPVPGLTGPANVCRLSDMIFDGSTSTNYHDHFWSIQKLSSSNPADSIFGTEMHWQYDNSVAGLFNFSSVVPAPYFSDGFYLVTLKVRNCDRWISRSIVVKKSGHPLRTNNLFYCCSATPGTVTLNAEGIVPLPSTGGTFIWYNRSGAVIGTGTTSTSIIGSDIHVYNSLTLPAPTTSEVYRVKFTGDDGCETVQAVYVLYVQDPLVTSFSLSTHCSGGPGSTPCGTLDLTANTSSTLCPGPLYTHSDQFIAAASSASATFLWNTGETTQTISVVPGNTYTVTVSNMCGSVTTSYSVPSAHPYMGALPTASDLTFTSGMIWGTGTFRIYGTGAFASWPAYNAHHYTLRIYDRWGALVYEGDKRTCSGWANGDISWNGIGNMGSYNGVRADGTFVYHFYLQLENCDDVSDYTSVGSVPWGTGAATLSGDFTIVH